MNALDPVQPYIVTHRRVLAIAIPMTLSSATTPLLGVVAPAVIGRLGQAQLLGTVAISSVVFDCLFWLFAFLRIGHGRAHRAGARRQRRRGRTRDAGARTAG